MGWRDGDKQLVSRIGDDVDDVDDDVARLRTGIARMEVWER